MSNSRAAESGGDKHNIVTQIQATLDYMPTDPQQAAQIAPWLRWQVGHFLNTLGPADLTHAELVTLVGLLGPAFARRIGGKPPLPATKGTLRVVV